MKFRISPYGSSGWTVEQEVIEIKYVKVGFFFTRDERREVPCWQEVYLFEDNCGRLELRTKFRSFLNSIYVPWPNDKNKVKKILDEFIDREKKIEKADEEHRIAVKQHRLNNPPEEYP